ncbi:MAG: GldG family protein [Gammaproteobacteria bacterium]|nr:GldG family protein [Gammaproteobacteria bacterium]
MKLSAQSRKQLRLANVSFVLLFLLAIGLLQWLSRDYHLEFDWTQSSRHSLSEASIKTLDTLDKPVHITAFASKREGRRKAINALIDRYRKHKNDITLEFVDPDENPEKVREANIQYDGELLLEYNNSRETLTKLNEENLTNTLTRLGHAGDRWLVFLDGHGERSPDKQRNFDLSLWADQLQKRGFKARSLNLAENTAIPENTTALVIASPQTALLKGEVEAIRRYIEQGGNLLWLNDPAGSEKATASLRPIAEIFGIEFMRGMVIDAEGQLIAGNAANVIMASYNSHPIVKNFSTMTVFPTVGAIQHQDETENSGWKPAIVLDTRENTWVETGRLDAGVQFDKGRDTQGPVTVAISFSRDNGKQDKGAEQRILVIADGDFLSNSYLGNVGNLDLGLSMANWLSQDDAYVSIPVRAGSDQGLNLSHTAQITIALIFMVFIPLALIVTGVLVWWRRRKY